MVLGPFFFVGVSTRGEDGVVTVGYDGMIRSEVMNLWMVLELWGMTE